MGIVISPYNLSIKSLRPILRNSLMIARRSSGLYQKKEHSLRQFFLLRLGRKDRLQSIGMIACIPGFGSDGHGEWE